MRRVKESLHVIADGNQNPKMFYRGGNWFHVVSVIDGWREIHNWWDYGGETYFYIVSAHNFGVYELCRNEKSSIWYLTGIFD